jgi:DNA polymerase III epsilon subunit-like protein
LTQTQRKQIDKAAKGGVPHRQIGDSIDPPATYSQVRWYLQGKSEAEPRTAVRTVVWDLETTNLRADIGGLVVAAFLDPDTYELEVRSVNDFEGRPGHKEKQLAMWAAEQFCAADILIGHNSLAFDRNFLNGVLGRHMLSPLPKRVHADTYLITRYGLKGLLQSASLENVADYFGIKRGKDKPSKHDWREANMFDGESVDRIVHRCVEDVRLNADVWPFLKQYWHSWKGQ